MCFGFQFTENAVFCWCRYAKSHYDQSDDRPVLEQNSSGSNNTPLVAPSSSLIYHWSPARCSQARPHRVHDISRQSAVSRSHLAESCSKSRVKLSYGSNGRLQTSKSCKKTSLAEDRTTCFLFDSQIYGNWFPFASLNRVMLRSLSLHRSSVRKTEHGQMILPSDRTRGAAARNSGC